MEQDSIKFKAWNPWSQWNKVESKNRRKTETFINTWKLNYTVSNNKWVEEEITKDSRKYFEDNYKDATKAVLRGKFMPVNTYIV